MSNSQIVWADGEATYESDSEPELGISPKAKMQIIAACYKLRYDKAILWKKKNWAKYTLLESSNEFPNVSQYCKNCVTSNSTLRISDLRHRIQKFKKNQEAKLAEK